MDAAAIVDRHVQDAGWIRSMRFAWMAGLALVVLVMPLGLGATVFLAVRLGANGLVVPCTLLSMGAPLTPIFLVMLGRWRTVAWEDPKEVVAQLAGKPRASWPRLVRMTIPLAAAVVLAVVAVPSELVPLAAVGLAAGLALEALFSDRRLLLLAGFCLLLAPIMVVDGLGPLLAVALLFALGIGQRVLMNAASGDPDRLARLVRFAPVGWQADMALVDALHDAGRLDEARALAERVLREATGRYRQALLLERLGFIELDAGEVERAEVALRASAAAMPAWPGAVAGLAEVALRRGDAEGAVQLAEAAGAEALRPSGWGRQWQRPALVHAVHAEVLAEVGQAPEAERVLADTAAGGGASEGRRRRARAALDRED